MRGLVTRLWQWFKAQRLGLLTGLVAALAMTLVMVALRATQGVASPIDLGLERLAPFIKVPIFLFMLGLVGGYNNLKILGVSQIVIGQLVLGALGGAVYAMVTERDRARGRSTSWPLGISPRGLGVLLGLVVGVWLAHLLILWPVLGTNYSGLPIPQGRLVTAAALALAYIIYTMVLIIGYGVVAPTAAPVKVDQSRRVLVVGGVGLLFALVAGEFFRRLFQRATFAYDGTSYSGAKVQAVTPNNAFYSVTKNVIDPVVDLPNWRLEVTGLVDRPQTLSFSDLTALPTALQETTLMCISNAVGGGLMSNAVWKGVPLRSLLETAGAHANAVKIVMHGVDGYTDTITYQKAMDPTTIMVYEMNGAPIPDKHGFPARVIVPGQFGEKNVKWVTRIEVVDYDAQGFYQTQGWGPNFVIPTHSRFDSPDLSKPLPVNMPVMFKGIAFGGDRGVSKVEVSLDNGQTWQAARIDYPGTKLTWALWSYDWRPAQAGAYTLVVRATDGMGALQTAEERPFAPQGATGYHYVTAHVV